MHRGYTKIWRKIDDWDWLNDPNTFYVFIRLILKANWQDKKWRGREIKRGELITSLSKLSEEFNLSVQQIRTCLDKLESTQDITRLKDRLLTHIRVNNYNKYQEDNKDVTRMQQGCNKDVTTTKEYKNIRINNKSTSKFEKVMDLLTAEKVSKYASEYKISPEDVKKTWKRMVTSRLSRGVPYSNWHLGFHNWIQPMIDRGEIKQIRSAFEHYQELENKKNESN